MTSSGALREAFAQKERLVFLDFITDQTENVFPMVPGGKGLTEMILAERALTMRHILSILVENEAGALSRISGLFSARGYNIESLTVAPTEDPTMSRMTIVTSGSDDVIEQITKQLNKLVEVVKVVDLILFGSSLKSWNTTPIWRRSSAAPSSWRGARRPCRPRGPHHASLALHATPAAGTSTCPTPTPPRGTRTRP